MQHTFTLSIGTILGFACVLFFILTGIALAAPAEFQPIVGIPGLDTKGSTWTLPEYVNKIYLLVIGIGALIGVIKISMAGVKYALSDIVTEKSDAKHDIQGVLLGLLILLVPFLVLSQIYSGLTKLDVLKLDPVNSSAPAQQTSSVPQTACTPFTQTITESFSDTDTSKIGDFINTCTCSNGRLSHGTPYGIDVSHTDYTCTL